MDDGKAKTKLIEPSWLGDSSEGRDDSFSTIPVTSTVTRRDYFILVPYTGLET